MMGPIHRHASVEEFHNLPWQMGYKHEYYGGKIHISVSHSAIVTFRLTLQNRPHDKRVRSLATTDSPGLVALYRLALRHVPEYVEYPTREFDEKARKAVEGYLSKQEPRCFEAACVIPDSRCMLAAAFLVETRIGPILQPIFVRPSNQRQGLGTVVMHHVENALLEIGATHLYSNCHLANTQSLAWHHRYGFEELPDVWIATHRWRYYSQELERRQRLQQITPKEVLELEREVTHWHSESKRLDEIERADFQAAHPGMKLWR